MYVKKSTLTPNFSLASVWRVCYTKDVHRAPTKTRELKMQDWRNKKNIDSIDIHKCEPQTYRETISRLFQILLNLQVAEGYPKEYGCQHTSFADWTKPEDYLETETFGAIAKAIICLAGPVILECYLHTGEVDFSLANRKDYKSDAPNQDVRE